MSALKIAAVMSAVSLGVFIALATHEDGAPNDADLAQGPAHEEPRSLGETALELGGLAVAALAAGFGVERAAPAPIVGSVAHTSGIVSTPGTPTSVGKFLTPSGEMTRPMMGRLMDR